MQTGVLASCSSLAALVCARSALHGPGGLAQNKSEELLVELNIVKHAIRIVGVILCVALGAQAALAQATPPPRSTPTPIDRSTPVRSTPTVAPPSRATPTSVNESPPPRATPTSIQVTPSRSKEKSPESTPIGTPVATLVATPALLPVSGFATPDARPAPEPWWVWAGFGMVCLGFGILVHRRRQRPE